VLRPRETSAAFSWNAYGVASTIACGLVSPSRAMSSRCAVTMVGLVSPDPMIASTRTVATAAATSFAAS